MFQEIDVNKIVVKDNVRQEYGDITELVASIKEHGVLTPIEINKENILVDGHRRLMSAKKAGESKIKFFYSNDKVNKTVSQLISGMFQKNLTPVEEAEAFNKYITETKHNSIHLAKMLGKQEQYVERRLALLDLSPEVKKALNEKKIQLGHAVVLSRFSKSRQKEVVKDIIEDDVRVSDLTDVLEADDCISLDDVPFDKKDCKECKYNGNEQKLLFDAGDCVKDQCLNPKCAIRKVNDWIKDEKETLKKKGINVVESEKIKEIKGAEQVSNYYQDEYKEALKNLDKKPDTFAVVFHKSEYATFPEKQIWRIKPKQQEKMTQEEVSVDEQKILNLSRKEKLQRKISDYRRTFLIKNSKNLLKPSVQLKSVILWKLLDSNQCTTAYDEVLKMFNISSNYDKDKLTRKIFGTSDEELDKALTIISKQIFHDMYNDALKIAGKSIGVDYKTHFKMDEEFLKLHTKEQLIKLSKELGINVEGLNKNDPIRQAILAGWKEGQVPKILSK